jgi:hypothetical protein
MADDISGSISGLEQDPPLLRLYVARGTPNSVRAEANLASAISHATWAYELEIVDVFKEALRAIADRVIVTPTLLVIRSGERQILVGDLGDSSELSRILRTTIASSREPPAAV